MNEAQVLNGLFWFFAFLFSTTLHEAAHAWAALRGGDETAYLGGHVTLSPLPHIRREPIGMLVVPLLTALTQGWAIGWASVPYDPLWQARHPHRAAWMAAAGPAANFLIAITAFGLLKLGLSFGIFGAPEVARFEHLVDPRSQSMIAAWAGQVLSILLVLNVLLGTFNLIPLPPLDGSTVIGLFFPESVARKIAEFTRTPMFSLAGLLLAWKVFPRIASPLFGYVLALLHPGHSYSG